MSFAALWAVATDAAPADDEPAGETFFKQSVVPILESRCLRCHRGVAARGDLSLETVEDIRAAGVIEPGEADDSLLVDMISGEEPPMPDGGPPLSSEEVSAIRHWIDSGAPWPEGLKLRSRGEPIWWSLAPLERPRVPQADSPWIRTPIDAFVLARLRENGLEPAPEADRRTLIRRLTYDLHGLPPSPSEIDEFLDDDTPGAYERLIDRLLDSPRYGERWARHWLDVVHYGETHGYDKDKRRDHAWPFRDYVIRSLNANKPYAQFVMEQIAGDVLAPDDANSIIATGFVAAGPWDFVGHVELREGTVEKKKTRSLDRDDMVAATIATFNSMTVHCARCHDHPFDPIPQEDHYRLQAVFAGVDRGDRSYPDAELSRHRAKVAQRRDALKTRLAELESEVRSLTSRELADVQGKLQRLRKQRAETPDPWSSEGRMVTSTTNGYHSAISETEEVPKWVQVDLGRSLPIEAIRLVPARPTDFPDAPGFGFPIRFEVAVSDEAEFDRPRVVANHAQADFANPGDHAVAIYLPRGDEAVAARYVRITAYRLWERSSDFVFALAELEVDSDGKNVAAGLAVTALDSIEAGRWSRRHLVDGHSSRHEIVDPADPQAAETLQQRAHLEREVQELAARRSRLVESLIEPSLREEMARLTNDITELEQQINELPSAGKVYALVAREPRPIHVLVRGNVTEPLDEVGPGALSCVGELPAVFEFDDPADEGSRRLALARWLTDERNVLTWRSIVNRVWHYHFGRGLVDTPSDFGRNGSMPTHPELLNWLAVEFRDGGGSLKALHRLLLQSAVYRQQSRGDERFAEIDGNNRFLWRMNRRRLEAEALRDAVLSLSGKLDLAMGGPSFEAFEFEDDHSPRYRYVAMNRPETWRRTIYRYIVRSVPDPFLEALDCPSASLQTPVRQETLTALQALALLNDPFMIDQAKHFARRLERFDDDPAEQINRAVLLALGRPPSDEERTSLVAYAQRHGLAGACRLLLNTNEFMFVD